MSIKSLPSNPSLEHLKYQARDLLNALNQGNAEAVARAKEFHPRFVLVSDDEIRASKLSLSDAYLVVAREYGFESWPKLKHHVEVSAQPALPAVGSLSGLKPPAGPVELKQKWPAGARIVKEMDLKQIMEIQTPGKSQPVEHKLHLTSQYAYTVANELPGGGREVELQHLSFRMEYESGGLLWRYDSARSSAVDQSPIADLFKTIMGANVRYFLGCQQSGRGNGGRGRTGEAVEHSRRRKTETGNDWDNKALDKVLNRLISGAPHPLEGVAAGLRKMYSKDNFKDRMDSSFLPGKAVQAGDTWNFSRESHRHSLINVGIIRDCTVTFQGWEMRREGLCSRLEFRGTGKTSHQHQSKAANVKVPITDGTFSGVAWFDPESGRWIEVNSNHDFKVTRQGCVTILPDPAGAGSIQLVTDHHHQVITEKLVSVSELGGSS